MRNLLLTQPRRALLLTAKHSIFFTQCVGAPLYFANKDWFYAYMAMTKRSFAITTSLMTHIWGPTTIRISGDESVAGQIEATPEGGVQFNFPERAIVIANHQVSRHAAKIPPARTESLGQ